MGVGRHRNQRCWCGSGKKYKVCHFLRESAEPPTPQETLKGIKSSQRLTHCLHPGASPTSCSAKIARSHTVPRSSLATIARKGHVYTFDSALPTLIKTRGRIGLRLVGLAAASVFTGFCERHDNDLFAPLEKCDFAITAETAFLLTFRAIAREIHDKSVNARQYDTWLEFDRGRTMDRQMVVHEKSLLFQVGTRAALHDLLQVKERLDAYWLQADFSESYFLAFELEEPPSAMCSGSTTPEEDFDGRVLQDLGDLLTPSDHVGFSSFANSGSGWVVFSWIGPSKAAEALHKTLLRQSPETMPHSLFRYLIEYVGNTYLRPDWWEQLNAAEQEAIRWRMQAGVQPELRSRSRVLLDDGLRVVNWSVKNVVQRLANGA